MRRENGRPYFYQWELNQRLIVAGDCTMVHFANGTRREALSCEVFEEDDVRLVNVPNELLQTAAELQCYAWDEKSTSVTEHISFAVEAREKPVDYVYTPTEVKRYNLLEEQLKALEESAVGKKTAEGGEIFGDYENNRATAKFAATFGSYSGVYAPGGLAGGFRIARSGADITYDEDGRQLPEDEADWRYNEVYGYGGLAFGKGAVCYARAGKSMGYRTQVGYPPSAEIAALRPEAIVKTDEEGNPIYPADNVGQGGFAIGSDTAALANNTFVGGWCSVAGSYNALGFGDHVEAWADHAVALNYKTKANAMGAISVGSGTVNEGKYSVGGGLNGHVSGNYSLGMGMKYKLLSHFAITSGLENIVQSNCAAVFGAGLVTPQQMVDGKNTGNGYAISVVGQYNAYANGELDTALFAVGNGTSDADRKNAFIVNKDGYVNISGDTKVAGTLSAKNVNASMNLYVGISRFGGTATFNGEAKFNGTVSMKQIDTATREMIITHKKSQNAPTTTDKGDFVGQMWIQLDQDSGVTAVYTYCGLNGPTGSTPTWFKIG